MPDRRFSRVRDKRACTGGRGSGSAAPENTRCQENLFEVEAITSRELHI